MNIKCEEKYMWEDYIVCPNCKYEGNGVTGIQGSGCIEILLWLFMIFPGLIYSIWRRTGKMICPECRNPYIVKKQKKVPYVWKVFAGKIAKKVFLFLLVVIAMTPIFIIVYQCTSSF